MLISVMIAAALALHIAASISGPFIDGKSLLEDVKTLKLALTTIHPGLYRYQSASQLDQAFADLDRRLAKGATQAEAFLAFSEFTARIQCGHTFPSFWNQPAKTRSNLFMGKNKLPVAFRWLNERMIVTRNDSKVQQLTPGTEITKINGQSAKSVLRRLMKLVKGDGANDAKRIAELQLQDGKKWEAFDIYYALAYHPGSIYDLEVRDLGGRKGRVQVEAIDQAEREAIRAKNSAPVVKNGVEWQWEWARPKTAVLTMPNWALYNSKWDWQSYLQQRFEELDRRGATSLILDVRGNAGGNECGDEIMRFLVPQKTSFESGTTFIRYQKIPDNLRPALNTWDPAFYDWSRETKPKTFVPMLNADGFQIRGEDSVNAERGGLLYPKSPAFKGKVYVLVDAECSSATFQFAQQVRRFRVGSLIGQPTGGNCRGINGGAIFFTTLPNSQIELDIPIIAYLPAKPQPNAGLKPDFHISDTREDIAAGIDSVMNFTLRKIDADGGTPKGIRR